MPLNKYASSRLTSAWSLKSSTI